MATYRELLEQRGKLDAEIARLQAEERDAVILEIRQKIQEYEIDINEIGDKLQRGRFIGSNAKKSPNIYRDPKTGKEWKGRGKPPNWIKFADNREKYRVK
ncbi:H-NS histone family protein [Paraburkholderia tropica]|uniref:H-NS histone family protein n=1 Tax=Paraburkholderia tropica TaxID=92647 RepID=UPI002AB648E7|nr:H-NS histone family protein [Paraburkholderia tropica]